MKKLLFCSTLALLTLGCATTSKDISAIYISPLQYASYDCEQLGMESQRIQVRASQLGARIDQSASNGNAATAVAVVIFWPAAFFTGSGNKEQQADFARLKGEKEAVDQAVIQKKCSYSSTVAQPQSGVSIDTSHLSLVEENRAQITKNGATYDLDTYIISFQRPYYVLVRHNPNKSMELNEVHPIATEYIKTRGCTTPISRRTDLDRSNSTKTQWLIGIEC